MDNTNDSDLWPKSPVGISRTLESIGFDYGAQAVRKLTNLGVIPSYKNAPNTRRGFTKQDWCWFHLTALLRAIDMSVEEIKSLNNFIYEASPGKDNESIFGFSKENIARWPNKKKKEFREKFQFAFRKLKRKSKQLENAAAVMKSFEKELD